MGDAAARCGVLLGVVGVVLVLLLLLLLLLGVVGVVVRRWDEAGVAVGVSGRIAEGRDVGEAGQAADAVGALGFEAGRGEGMLVTGTVGGGRMAVGLAPVAVFDGGGGEGREGGGCAGRGAPEGESKWSAGCQMDPGREGRRGTTHGASEGVSGREGGCGMLMRVGCEDCDILTARMGGCRMV